MLPAHLFQHLSSSSSGIESLEPLDNPSEETEEVDATEDIPAILTNPEISQQAIRSWINGDDCLCVTSRVQIQQDADREVLHIPIYPPMNSLPEVDAFVISGDELRIRVTHRQKFGVRLELIMIQQPNATRESIIELVLRTKKKETTCQPHREAA